MSYVKEINLQETASFLKCIMQKNAMGNFLIAFLTVRVNWNLAILILLKKTIVIFGIVVLLKTKFFKSCE